MLSLPRCLAFAFVFVSALAVGCGGTDIDADDDHHDGDEEPIGTTSSALVATDPVSAAVTQSCTTTAVKGLATQLVDEIQCLKPGSMKRIDNTAGLKLGAAVFPFLQTPAANALINAQKARGTTMSINSGLRTLPQQYLLYRWYQTGRCGIGLAARPGRSNHESGIAVDINDNAGWRSAMAGKSFRWLGASDPVHFDFIGGGTINMQGLSVLAFQRLWNRNNPNDKIAEDGAYGPMTEARLAKAPVGGFLKGANCNQPMAGDLPTTPSTEGEPPAVPDATEPSEDEETPPSQETNSAFLPETGTPAPSVEAGCSVGNGTRASGSVPLEAAAFLLFCGGALAVRRRRRFASE